MKQKGEQKNRSDLQNLWYWLKSLYRESPSFVWLYLLEIPLTIAISLLGAYLPSVLVADITYGRTADAVLKDLLLFGGTMAVCYVALSWVQQSENLKNDRISYNHSLNIIKEVMNTSYANIEKADFQSKFWTLQDFHLWSSTFTTEFLSAFVAVATAIIGMILYVGVLSGLSLWILLLAIAGTAINYAVGIYCNKWDAVNRHNLWNLDNKMAYLTRELSSYEASKDVHVYHMAPWLDKLFYQELKERLRGTVRQQAMYYVEGSTWALTQMLREGFAYFYLIVCVCNGTIDAAEFVLYFGILTGFAAWCSSIVQGMKKLNQMALYVEEQREFMEQLQEMEDTREALVLPKGHIPEITFRNVSFQYPKTENPIIRNFNLTMKAGENIALVGLNGAGKTTFIKLLCGFYEPTEGEILIDGVDRRNYSRESWLRCFSGVFQDTGFFPLTLEENLVPEGKADETRLRDCLQMADIEERLAKLPKGLQTFFGMGINDNAVEFSGGEAQKLMLARALYKESSFLVLDEPTAALDPLMESELYESYCEFSKQKTTVFISHRLASTRFCDRILLMEHGEIVEEGTHKTLLEQNGKYAAMFSVQSKYYQQKEAGLEGEEIWQ